MHYIIYNCSVRLAPTKKRKFGKPCFADEPFPEKTPSSESTTISKKLSSQFIFNNAPNWSAGPSLEGATRLRSISCIAYQMSSIRFCSQYWTSCWSSSELIASTLYYVRAARAFLLQPSRQRLTEVGFLLRLGGQRPAEAGLLLQLGCQRPIGTVLYTMSWWRTPPDFCVSGVAGTRPKQAEGKFAKNAKMDAPSPPNCHHEALKRAGGGGRKP